MLAYAMGGDATDKYCRLDASTAIEAIKQFVAVIQGVFEDTYLKLPTREDLQRQMSINDQRGFLGMFGSIV
jgi:hypothetical protein